MYDRVVPIVEGKYGIEVTISDVVDPNTGDPDGHRILIDYDQDLEVALFVLVQMGRFKWKSLGLEYKLDDVQPPSPDAVERACASFRAAGLKAC